MFVAAHSPQGVTFCKSIISNAWPTEQLLLQNISFFLTAAFHRSVVKEFQNFNNNKSKTRKLAVLTCISKMQHE